MLVAMAIRQRVLRLAGANAVGQGAAMATQLGLVPLFLAAWGVQRYGDWLLLSTVPAYLAASDLGFLSAAGNRLAALRAAHRDDEALAVHRLSWTLALGVAALVGVVTAAAVALVDLRQLLRLRTVSSEEAALSVVLLVAFAVVSQTEQVLQGAFRAEALAARGSLLSTASRTCAVVAAAVTALLGGELAAAAGAMLGAKVLLALVQLVVLRASSQLFRPGLHLDRAELRSLLAPSLAFVGLPLGNALTLQVFLVVLGHQVGAEELVAFSLARTLTRLATQLVSIVEGSIWPELSYAFGRGDLALMRRLHGRACAVTVRIAAAAAVVLALAGPAFLGIWTGGRVSIGREVLWLLCADLVVTSLWSTSAVLPAATNTGLGRVTAAFILLGGLSVLLLPVLTSALGLVGAPVAMLVCDLLMVPVVLRNSLRLLDQPWREFARGLAPRSALQPSS